MTSPAAETSSSARWLLGLCLVAGLALRLAALCWNDRLQGDVNLLALTAREYAHGGWLDYPMKYDFSGRVPYRSLHDPASQHPPLMPLAAGAIARVAGTDDTFLVLKLLCAAGGLLTLGTAALLLRRLGFPPTERAVALSLLLLSPMLTDFSANGSMYILLALWLTLASLLMLPAPHARNGRDADRPLLHFVAAGLLVAAAAQTHSLALPLLPTFALAWLAQRPRGARAWLGAGLFAPTLGAALAPWLLWNQRHFGRAFYSYSAFDLQSRLHNIAIVDDAGRGLHWSIIQHRLAPLLPAYGRLLVQGLRDFGYYFLFEVGPFWLILGGIGLASWWRLDRRRAAALLLPALVCALTAVAWAHFKFRFLCCVIPAAYLLAARGFVTLHAGGKAARWTARLCLTGTFAWMGLAYVGQPPTRYYPIDHEHQQAYYRMREVADALAKRPPGVVLGYAHDLDGGIESVYWHRHPYVHASPLPAQFLPRLAADFGARYIWTDTARRADVSRAFPAAHFIEANDSFVVLELEQR